MIVGLQIGKETSIGTPGKNYMKILDRQMNEYPLMAAYNCAQIQKIFISTDSKKIRESAEKYEATIINRPRELATPESLTEDPINFYSLIHFIEYSILSMMPFIKNIHFWSISITWEILELFIKFDWARESWLNKLCDLIFNWSGFYLIRRLFRIRRKF